MIVKSSRRFVGSSTPQARGQRLGCSALQPRQAAALLPLRRQWRHDVSHRAALRHGDTRAHPWSWLLLVIVTYWQLTGLWCNVMSVQAPALHVMTGPWPDLWWPHDCCTAPVAWLQITGVVSRPCSAALHRASHCCDGTLYLVSVSAGSKRMWYVTLCVESWELADIGHSCLSSAGHCVEFSFGHVTTFDISDAVIYAGKGLWPYQNDFLQQESECLFNHITTFIIRILTRYSDRWRPGHIQQPPHSSFQSAVINWAAEVELQLQTGATTHSSSQTSHSRETSTSNLFLCAAVFLEDTKAVR